MGWIVAAFSLLRWVAGLSSLRVVCRPCGCLVEKALIP
jgi:hypothetical protein